MNYVLGQGSDSALKGGEIAWLVVLAIAAIAAIRYYGFTAKGKEAWQKSKAVAADKSSRKAERARYARSSLKDVGVQGPMGLACPNCGGTQFTPGRAAFGAYGATNRKRKVSCVTCGVVFRRD